MSKENKRIGSKGFGEKAKGNQWWRQRASSGRNKIFSSPEELWKAACEYFDYTDSRKWYKTEFKGSDVIEVKIPTDTPYTIQGLCIFLDITFDTWVNYKTKEGYEDFFEIIKRIEQIIYNQKFEGATVGAYNPSIIARDLGLTDKREIDNKGQIAININSDEEGLGE